MLASDLQAIKSNIVQPLSSAVVYTHNPFLTVGYCIRRTSQAPGRLASQVVLNRSFCDVRGADLAYLPYTRTEVRCTHAEDNNGGLIQAARGIYASARLRQYLRCGRNFLCTVHCLDAPEASVYGARGERSSASAVDRLSAITQTQLLIGLGGRTKNIAALRNQ